MLLPVLVASILASGIVVGHVGPVLATPYHEPGYDLRICPSPDVDPAALYTATEWWSDHGVWFVIDRDPSIACVQLLVDPSLDSDGLRGLTLFDPAGFGAVVLLTNGHDALAIAHELGHVAGFGHTPLAPSGCIMAPRRVGWSDRGLPRDVRIRKNPQGW